MGENSYDDGADYSDDDVVDKDDIKIMYRIS